ncbi:inositol monophosphatase family protein [Rhizobium sp. NRK18]|uniref:inositol monophosphatase family protein n=1 Tax=Rhizobium sp. NRK18 TaxID=2964667 RepID=UPI0021C49942|nr:inositol monophosphatase family protein [Rhizobium sp. NRK18]MCQ2004053.1 inositol monophosphatase [Rhizobium sp. NRK18]
MTLDVKSIADLLRSAAKAEILPRFRRLGGDDVRIKSELTDLVTEADEAAECRIRAEFEALAPGYLFVGEESVAADPDLLGKLATADKALVVDPIDGTFNFASGLPLFGVMAAVISGGETVAGIIYDPMGDDWMIAEKGAGTYFVRPDGHSERAKVAEPLPLEEMMGIASVGFLPKEKRPEIMANLAKARYATSYRCAAHEYRAFCGGHIQFLMYNKLMPWDHLAGTLMSQEAGAYAARFDGSAYRPQHTSGGLLIAPDKETWEMLRREVFTV